MERLLREVCNEDSRAAAVAYERGRTHTRELGGMAKLESGPVV
jgi:hypothetical protein